MARPKSATVDLKVRMKEPLRAKIETAARMRGVSLNNEVVQRLTLSFEREGAEKDRREAIRDTVLDGIYESFGGLQNFGIMKILAGILQNVEYRMGESWLEDPDAFRETLIGINAMLEEIAPPAPTDERSPLRSVVVGTGQIGMWAKDETWETVRRKLQEAQKQKAKS